VKKYNYSFESKLIKIPILYKGILEDVSIQATFTYAFKQSNPLRFENKTDDYFLTDLNLSEKAGIGKQEVILGFTVENLFDVQYINHLSTLKPLGYYNMGRNILFSLKIPLSYNL